MTLRAQFLAFDDALSAHGVPPLTQWWRTGIGAWLDVYEAGGPLELTGCIGRGAAKSTAIYKIGLFFALAGRFEVPPGERHFAIILSRLKEEATKGIAIISRWLTLLGERHRVAGDVIELESLPRGIRVVAASVAASSGWRAFFIGKDERSKWPSDGAEDLEASEIDTSAGAMTATHPRAPIVSMGSAWGDFGEFYDAVTTGTNERRVVLGPAPTWIAAPHIKREDLERKEPDPKKFAREYQCVFQTGATAALDPELVRAAVRPFRPGYPLGPPVMGFDSSMGRGDSTCWIVGQWWQFAPLDSEIYEGERTPDGSTTVIYDANGLPKKRTPAPETPKPVFCIFSIGAFDGKFAERGVTSDDVVSHVASIANTLGAHHIFADQFQGFANTSAFARFGLAYIPQNWSNESKSDALMRTRTWLRDRCLSIQPGAEGSKLAGELIGLRETIRPSGSIGLGARRGGSHDDRAACLLNLALADTLGELRGSRIAINRKLVVGHQLETEES